MHHYHIPGIRDAIKGIPFVNTKSKIMSRKLTRSRLKMSCRCKVGACTICGSSCKRCKCACDGVLPFDAFIQKVGAQSSVLRSRRKIHLALRSGSRITRSSKKYKMGTDVDDQSYRPPEKVNQPIRVLRKRQSIRDSDNT